MQERLGWVDYAKGIGIILVVASHDLGGQINAGLPSPPLAKEIIDYAYSYQIPLFFLLSGLFVERSFSKGARQFLASRSATLLYPFVVWSLLQGIVQSVLSRYVNHPSNIRDVFLGLLTQPVGQMWYLESLYLMMLIYAGLSVLKLRRHHFFLLSLPAAVLSIFIHSHIPHVTLHRFIFFAVGIWLTRPIRSFLQASSEVRLIWVCLLATLLQCAILFYLLPMSGIRDVLRVDAEGMLGILSAISCSELLDRKHWLGWLAWVGRYSLAILVMHALCSAGSRILLTHLLKLNNGWILFINEMAFGVGLPIAVAMFCEQRGWTWLLAWPMKRSPTALAQPTV